MTTTVTWYNLPTAPTDVAVKFLDQTKLEQRSLTLSPDGFTKRAEYVYADGSLAYSTLVSVQCALDPKSGITRNSVRLSTVITVDVDGVITAEEPIEVSMNWNVKGSVRDIDKLSALLGACYSLTFNGVTTKVPNTGILSAISRQITHELFS